MRRIFLGNNATLIQKTICRLEKSTYGSAIFVPVNRSSIQKEWTPNQNSMFKIPLELLKKTWIIMLSLWGIIYKYLD